jgi:hypothetical protein
MPLPDVITQQRSQVRLICDNDPDRPALNICGAAPA